MRELAGVVVAEQVELVRVVAGQSPEVFQTGPPLGVVVGPLCTPLDLLGTGVPMPDVRQGSVVAIPNVGAYGLSASLVDFLGSSLQKVVPRHAESVDRVNIRALRLAACSIWLHDHGGPVDSRS